MVNVGIINAGTLGNIIPPEAMLRGGIRWYKDHGGEKILELMNRMAEGIGIAHNVTCTISVDGGVPPVVNNIPMIEEAKTLLRDMDTLKIADQTDPICAGDNYGYLLQSYPGFYGILGGGKHNEEIYPQHHPKFDLDEKAFRKGAEFMTRYAINFLT